MDENIINDLNNELESVIEEGHSMLRDAELEEKFQEIKTEAELLIRKYPISSVALGAAVGFLIGKIFR
ncbi:MAG: hypothetical protein JJU37_09055 [Balneolaceae bacterium]|nr:hypothetical protein [Balneolaceae bacterium]